MRRAIINILCRMTSTGLHLAGRSLAWRLGGDHQTALPPPVSRPPASRRLAGPEPQPREVPQHPVSARELLRSATAAPPARVCQMDQRGVRSILQMVPVQLLDSDAQRRALSDPPHRCAPALVNFAGQSLQAAPAESGGVAHQIGGCVWTGAPRLMSTRNFRVLDHQTSLRRCRRRRHSRQMSRFQHTPHGGRHGDDERRVDGEARGHPQWAATT